jgi:transposase
MEACCGAHHLGRVFAGHGHDVGLTSPESVRPYVKAQKNDDRDAEGIAEAATRFARNAHINVNVATLRTRSW